MRNNDTVRVWRQAVAGARLCLAVACLESAFLTPAFPGFVGMTAQAASQKHRPPARHTSATQKKPHDGASSGTGQVLDAARAREAELRDAARSQAQKLKQAQQTKSAAAAQAAHDHARATALSSATVAAAATLQKTEGRVQEVRSEVDDLKAEQRATQDAIDTDAKALQPLLPIAHRLSLYPTDVLLTSTAPTGDVVRGLLVMKGLAGSLEERAQDLRQHQDELAAINGSLSSQLDQLDSLAARQEQQRNALAAQAGEARDAQTRSNEAAKSASANAAQEAVRQKALQAELAQVLAAEAAAMAQLRREAEAAERARKAREAEDARQRARAAAEAARSSRAARQKNSPEPTPPPLASRASRRPEHGGDGLVAGRLLTAWGQQTEGGAATGNSYAASPGSSVRSPCAGTVEFASSFRSYGQMLILNCGRGYRFVLAGMGSLNVTLGQSLSKGASVGSMPASDGGTLLVQLRNGARSVNPSPFL